MSGPSEPQSSEVAVFTGGLRWRGWNVTIPLAQLQIGRDGVRAVVGRWLIFPAFEVVMPWETITRVQRARWILPLPASGGAAFFGRRRLVFWCTRSDREEIIELVQRDAPESVDIATGWHRPI
jgi:hypothetical protein